MEESSNIINNITFSNVFYKKENKPSNTNSIFENNNNKEVNQPNKIIFDRKEASNPYNLNNNKVELSFHHVIDYQTNLAIFDIFFNHATKSDKITLLNNMMNKLNEKLKSNNNFLKNKGTISMLNNISAHIDNDKQITMDKIKTDYTSCISLFSYFYANGFIGPVESLRVNGLKAKDGFDRLAKEVLDYQHFSIIKQLNKNYEDYKHLQDKQNDQNQIYESIENIKTRIIEQLLQLSKYCPNEAITYVPEKWDNMNINKENKFYPKTLEVIHQNLAHVSAPKEISNNKYLCESYCIFCPHIF